MPHIARSVINKIIITSFLLSEFSSGLFSSLETVTIFEINLSDKGLFETKKGVDNTIPLKLEIVTRSCLTKTGILLLVLFCEKAQFETKISSSEPRVRYLKFFMFFKRDVFK